jgi:uncharacterized protein with GYD domain
LHSLRFSGKWQGKLINHIFKTEAKMAKHLIMGKYTQQGIKNIEETVQRADSFKEIAAEYGIEVLDIYWLNGEYDVVNIVDAPNDESLEALRLRVGAWGNVTTTTIRAFDKDEMIKVLEKMRNI